MGNQNLAYLCRRQSYIMIDKSNMQGRLNSINTEISRLEEASLELATQVASLTTANGHVRNLTVNEGKWKGIKKDKFITQYDTYKSNIGDLISKTKERKDQLDDEIKQAQATRKSYIANISGYSSQITSLNDQIEREKKEWEPNVRASKYKHWPLSCQCREA